ncbi:MAG: carboxypeptidase M32 [Planctomycetota bacterium]
MTHSEPTLSEPIRALRDHLASVQTFESIGQLVSWDQETYMPSKAAGFRAEEMSALSSLIHERKTSGKAKELIDEAEGSAQAKEDSQVGAMVREAKRDYEKASKLPGALVAELAEVGSRAQEAWKTARKNNDFPAFQPWLEKMIALTVRKAECYGVPDGGEIYDALLDEYEPNARAAEIEAVFAPLADKLSGLVADLLDHGTRPDDAPVRTLATEAVQHKLGLKVIEALGFDTEAGRLDVTTHPFCSGFAPGDTRLTTRYREESFTDALYGTMHECGHGLYEQGLPKMGSDGERSAWFGTPLTEAVSLGIHESQSRMWENQLGRSRAFWSWAKPVLSSIFGGAFNEFDAETFYKAVNTVERSYIRVEADEATYNLHVMLRFGIERAMVKGDLKVADLPGVWNERFEKLLGEKVPDDTRGCLQDVHWSFGLIGYFPTYTLGNLYSAQFWEKINEEHPDLEDKIAAGDFSQVLAWNREHIHQHGRRYSAGELCERATGKALSPEPLLRHLEGKLRPIYGV